MSSRTSASPRLLAGLATLLLAAGCTDAKQVAEAYEAVCKTNCDCPNGLDDWNNVKHCKAACEGESKSIEHAYLDRETSPCKDIDKISRRIKDCAKQDCNDLLVCVATEADDLLACWPDDNFGVGEAEEYVEHLEVREAMREQITAPFPETLLEAAFESSTYDEVD